MHGKTYPKIRETNIFGYLIISGIAGSSIGLELVQTRILSLLYYNHIVYLTVTIAMLGLGISGVLISLFYKRVKDKEKLLLLMIEGYFFSFITCISASSYLPVLMPNYPALFKLILSYSLLIIPFFFSGACISLIFLTYGKNSHKIYFADLVSACFSVLIYTFFLERLSAPGFLWMNLFVILIVYFLQTYRLKISLAGPLVLSFFYFLFYFLLNGKIINQIPEVYKVIGKVQLPEWTTEKLEESRWTTIAKIDVWSDSFRDLLSGAPSNETTHTKVMTQDGDALTMMNGPEKVDAIFRKADSGEAAGVISLIYLLKKNPSEALIIGVGGGIDIVNAEAYGAGKITGVELNPAIVDLTTKRYSDFLKWPKWQNVSLVRSEGRNYLSRNPKKFDTIFLNGVDTFSALNSGAYVLSENYLYTVEAIKDFLRALKPDGVVGISRWLYLKPRESLRLSATILQALRENGVKEPEKSVIVISEDYGWPILWASTFFKESPFTKDEVLNVLHALDSEKTIAPVYIPDIFDSNEKREIYSKYFIKNAKLDEARGIFSELMANSAGGTLNEFYNSYEYKITPVHDDKPFFFEYYKFRNYNWRDFIAGLTLLRGPVVHYTLYILLGLALLFCLVFIIGPLFLIKQGTRLWGMLPIGVSFASLGLGYMFFEIGAMQYLNLYLGDPIYSFSLVLSGLLFFSGVGSFIAGKINSDVINLFKKGFLLSFSFILLWLFYTKFMISGTKQLFLNFRIVLSLLSLVPAAIFMGFPFATGMKYLSQNTPRFVPWAIGINSTASVLASILAIILAMKYGFTSVIVAASLSYLAGFLILHFRPEKS